MRKAILSPEEADHLASQDRSSVTERGLNQDSDGKTRRTSVPLLVPVQEVKQKTLDIHGE